MPISRHSSGAWMMPVLPGVPARNELELCNEPSWQIIMIGIFKLMRTTAFLVVLAVSLATTAVSMGIWAISLTAQVSTMTASAAAAAIANRKAIAAAMVRTKAKARLRRVMVALPIAGVAAAIAFERQDYLEWKQDNPVRDVEDYGCEVGTVSAEVIDDVLQELPEQVRPSRDWLLARLPGCEAVDPD
ncbi:MAG: hypothetical protein ABJN75_22935 [Hoeflea sp.]|uniref:hypothetical protein n=1 Tax=Hoeflea sp. TaxID=1940281 RepID=UPI0032970AC6